MACRAFATLRNGSKMPLVGYGTWQAKEGELEVALNGALEAGYRHIDTATAYENEGVIGKVLNDSWISKGKLKREDVFLVTKLPPVGMRPERVEKYLKRSLQLLGTDYVDLYLVHLPFGFQEDGDNLHPMNPDGTFKFDNETDHVAIWKEMEAQVDAGRARAIGLSNFNESQIQRVLDNCRVKPANLQVELHVYMQQRPLVELCTRHNITVTAYSPLGSRGTDKLFAAFGHNTVFPDLLANPIVAEVAKEHNKTPGQILLKHIVQRGICAIPKSTNPQRMKQNIEIFDFELTAEDVNKLNALDQGPAGRILDFEFMKGVRSHPEYPFRDEK